MKCMQILIILAAFVYQGLAWGAQGECRRGLSEITRYRWLEKNSPRRDRWIREQNASFLQDVQASHNYKPLSDIALKRLDVVQTLKETPLSDDAKVILKNLGINKPQELVLKTHDREEVLISSSDFKKNNTLNFFSFSLSPEKDFILVHASENGNIDDFKTYIYDIRNRKRIEASLLTSWTVIAWQTPHRFYYNDGALTKNGVTPLRIYDLKKGASYAPGTDATVLSSAGDTYTLQKSGKNWIKTAFGQKLLLPPQYAAATTVIGRVKSKVYLRSSAAHRFGNVIEADLTKEGLAAFRQVVGESAQKIIGNVTLVDRKLARYSYYGVRQFVDIYDPNKGRVGGFTVPDCCSVSKVTWDKNVENLTVTLLSEIVGKTDFVYSTRENKFIDQDLEKKMLSADGMQFTTYFEEAESIDGEKVPVRITHKVNLNRDLNNPSLIFGYGGFNVPGYIYPRRYPMNVQFLEDGGVLVAPILRGGSELGPRWHEEGMRELKQNVFNDMNSTAALLQQLRISKKEKIGIQGWSNGGMVMAAASLENPANYGFVVAGAGVQDMLRKEYLDPRFDSGWSGEYGDSREPYARAYISKYSPVKQAELGHVPPQSLIFVGQNDSRVNPAHTYKLIAALKDQNLGQPKASMMAMKNSGHWVTSPEYQNIIAWRAQVFIWTYIYDHFGMTMGNPK